MLLEKLPRTRVRFRNPLPAVRNGIQIVFALFLVYTGWQFAQFVAHFESKGAFPFVSRPASVEAFLPISALVAFRSWIGTGVFDTVHPAALVILLTVVGTSALFKKGFCSWICPIGTASEWLARLGRTVFGRNLRPPALLDLLLRGLKYLLLAFFLWAIVLSMTSRDASLFLRSPYNMMADVKMLQFFARPGTEVVAALVALAALSMLVSNFWCRYLCPYGALLGLASVLSPLKITRNASRCTNCGLCSRACPNRIDVANAGRVLSPECNACLECVAACKRKGALGLALPFSKPTVNVWVLPGLLLAAFVAAMVFAQVTGHWDTSLSYQDYARLIPVAGSLSH